MHGCQTAMDVQQEIDIRPQGFTHGLHHFNGMTDMFLGNEGAPGAGSGSNLTAVYPLLHHVFSRLHITRKVLYLVTPSVGIHADLIPARSAQQIIDGRPAALPTISHRAISIPEKEE